MVFIKYWQDYKEYGFEVLAHWTGIHLIALGFDIFNRKFCWLRMAYEPFSSSVTLGKKKVISELSSLANSFIQ
jgi:hypothetical protein